MSYCLQLDETIADGVPRIACEQVDQVLAELVNAQQDVREAVHRVRKHFKKLRALLRLVRGSLVASYRYENDRFRDLARLLSGPRDAQAILECCEKLIPSCNAQVEYAEFASLHALLLERCSAFYSDDALLDSIQGMVPELEQARSDVLDWSLQKEGFEALAEGFSRTYRGARKAMRKSYRTQCDTQFHEWRKRVKYHWNHLRLLRDVWPQPLQCFADQAKCLSDLLGDDHDLSVLCESLQQDSGWFDDDVPIEALQMRARARQQRLRSKACALGKHLFAQKQAKMQRRLQYYWEVA